MIDTFATPVPAPDAPAHFAVRRYVPLSTDQKNNPWNLLHCDVQYCHFDTSRAPFLGKVVDVDAVRMRVVVAPDKGQAARYPRWRSLFDVLAVVTTERAIVAAE